MALLLTGRELPPYLKMEMLNRELQDREKHVARRITVIYQTGRNPPPYLHATGLQLPGDSANFRLKIVLKCHLN